MITGTAMFLTAGPLSSRRSSRLSTYVLLLVLLLILLLVLLVLMLLASVQVIIVFCILARDRVDLAKAYLGRC